jgi:hypothetical protein
MVDLLELSPEFIRARPSFPVFIGTVSVTMATDPFVTACGHRRRVIYI